MCARDSRRTKEARNAKTPSVVGTKLGETSSLPSGRSFLKSVMREREGLRLAEGALGDSAVMVDDKEEGIGRFLRIVAIVSAGLVVLLVSVAIALAILANTSVFEITHVEAGDTDHVKSEDVVQLANVPEGSTLLKLKKDLIEENIKQNPWIASVEIHRVFPDTLRLEVHERKLGAVVAMGSGGIAWLLGDDGVWIEPLKLQVDENESVNDEALEQAASLGVVLISDVPSSVQPKAGTNTTDKSILTVLSIAGQLSMDFKNQVVCYSASSEDDISCILSNGVEVSMGSDSEIRTKEVVAKRILEQYAGQVTYINVRIPSRPTYRRIDSEYVREGTGATGSAVDEQKADPYTGDSSATEEEDVAEDDISSSDSSTDSEYEDSTSDYDTGYDEDYEYYEYYDDSYDYDSGYDSSYDYSYDYDSDYGQDESY